MLRLAMVQMAVSDSKAHNLRTAQRHILHAAQQGAKLIILPVLYSKTPCLFVPRFTRY